MRLTVVGIGCLGLTHAVCMADLGHEVLALDVDQDRVANVVRGELAFFEPGLELLLRRNLDTGRLRFTTSYAEAAEFGDVHFLCVDTPEAADGTADLRYVYAAADALAPHLAARCLVVGKSTVPVGTARKVMGRIRAAAPAGEQVDLAWNPEFLREGSALQDTLRPDRFVFGVASDWADGLLRHVYDLPLAAGIPGLAVDLETAEMVKVSADAFLATKISFINAMAGVCEAAGADVEQLAEALAYDERTGRRSLAPGPGLDGGWMPKDISAFRATAMSLGLDSVVSLLRDVDVINQDRQARVAALAREAVGESLAGNGLAAPDVAFKLSSDDVLDSPSSDECDRLAREGAMVSARDPVAMPKAVRAEPDPPHTQNVELTVVMPCLNEAETVATCVRKAVAFLAEHQIDGEVVVADNGSTDGSQRLARNAGARVIPIAEQGYGNALLGGIMAARGRYVVMGDADDSYDFIALMPFIARLRAGADLVMGNRFRGGIAPGAMPALHRYLGNPVLSFVGRLFFQSKIGDFHCGLRGFRRDSVLALGLQASGMEFASEMVVKATLAGQQVEEVPTTLSPDGRSRPPHLRSWRDGWRHLRFLLLFSPRWLFLVPGAALLALGLVIGVAVTSAPLTVGAMSFDVDTLALASAMIVIGFQSVLFALFTQVYASKEGFLPQAATINRLLAVWDLERVLLIGGLLALVGVAGLGASFAEWHGARFGHLDYVSTLHAYESTLRFVVPSVTALILSCQLILGAFFLSILGIRRTRHPMPLDVGHGGARIPLWVAQRGAVQTGLAEPMAGHDLSGELADA